MVERVGLAADFGAFFGSDPLAIRLLDMDPLDVVAAEYAVNQLLLSGAGEGYRSMGSGDVFSLEYECRGIEKYRCVFYPSVPFTFALSRLRDGERTPFQMVIRGSVAAGFRLTKAVCDGCECLVRVDDHVSRCRDGKGVHEKTDMMRRMAWSGDSLLGLDTRMVLLYRGVESGDLGEAYESWTKNEFLAPQYDVMVARYGLPRFPALGTTIVQRATAFEANYYGLFRERYLEMRYPGMSELFIQFEKKHITGLYDNREEK